MLDSLQMISFISIWPCAFILLVLILLQGGAGDVSSSFGGGGKLDSTLGVGASAKMSKITGVLVALFLAFVVVLAVPTDSSLSDSLGTVGSSEAAAPALISGDEPAEPAAAPAVVAEDTTTEAAAPVAPVEEAAPAAVEEVKEEVEAAVDTASATKADAKAPAAGLTLE